MTHICADFEAYGKFNELDCVIKAVPFGGKIFQAYGYFTTAFMGGLMGRRGCGNMGKMSEG